MKLSEAIVLGSTVVSPRPGGQFFPKTNEGCVLGIAAIAEGCHFRRVTGPVPQEARRTLGVEAVWGAWLLHVVVRTCDCDNREIPRALAIKDIIAHLFDHHVMKKKDWTLERLVAWVERWEPNEPSPVSEVGPADNGAPESAQDWQEVREAFEARYKSDAQRRDRRGQEGL